MGPCPLYCGIPKLKLTKRPSPNYGPRRDNAQPDLVVIHYTAMTSVEAAARTLCNPQAEVSAHYLIGENGQVLALVPEEQRAWHAGAGAWGDVVDVNSRSIGIELANTGVTPFASAQMHALERLLADIMLRWNIRPERVIGHSDMAPGRKIDPGARFDWLRLSKQGMAVWPNEPSLNAPARCVDAASFVQLMQHFGYTATNDATVLLASLRLRFRPRFEGPLDQVDMAMIGDLATRFPVDVDRATA